MLRRVTEAIASNKNHTDYVREEKNGFEKEAENNQGFGSNGYGGEVRRKRRVQGKKNALTCPVGGAKRPQKFLA